MVGTPEKGFSPFGFEMGYDEEGRVFPNMEVAHRERNAALLA